MPTRKLVLGLVFSTLLLALAPWVMAQVPEWTADEDHTGHVHDDLFLDLEAPPESLNLQTHSTHAWSCQNIFAIVDYGSHSYHRLDCQLRCAVGGETKYGSEYEGHRYQFTWWSYNQYSSTQHQYKEEYRCSTCGHVKVTSTLLSHQCQSIYDTRCDQCGYTNTRMCG